MTGAAISGRITDAGGVGLYGRVEIYDSNEKTAGYTYISNGNYSIAGLPSGNYKVQFIPDGNYVSEWYNEAANFGSAELLAVNAPNVLADINAVLSVGGTISGKVTDTTGKGISGIHVSVHDSNQNLIPTAMASWTDSDGNYTITGLPGGNHKVLFTSPQLCYANTWYGDKTDFSAAVPVSVTVSNTTENINAVPIPGGRISGKVTDAAGMPIASLMISAAYRDTFGTRALTWTDDNGNYSFCSLETGSYKVHFEPWRFFTDEWYNNKTDFQSADSIAVTAPNDTAGIDAVLAPEQTTGQVVPMTPILMLLLQK
ncbi:MAG: hypothetical protein D3922_02830 [Candidatus Electrothrix sp. AR1]|nr:hypothetical protein [Candidatus Electrothrix sp. AR1]